MGEVTTGGRTPCWHLMSSEKQEVFNGIGAGDRSVGDYVFH